MPTLHTPLPPITVVASSGEDSDEQAKDMIHSMLSYDGNVMLAAAVVSLLLVILFVSLLHLYAKWFLTHARHHRSGSSVAVPQVLGTGAGGFSPHFHALRVEVERAWFRNSPPANNKKKGVAQSVISSIPVFAYKGMGNGLECSICLSGFEDGEVGRKLPKCRHAFHAECIDMWLYSHSSCPICRAPVTAREITYSSSPPRDDRNTPLEITVEVPNI
nr:RING-H2 finger protein ATL63 [Ipomoea batatas]